MGHILTPQIHKHCCTLVSQYAFYTDVALRLQKGSMLTLPFRDQSSTLILMPLQTYILWGIPEFRCVWHSIMSLHKASYTCRAMWVWDTRIVLPSKRVLLTQHFRVEHGGNLRGYKVKLVGFSSIQTSAVCFHRFCTLFFLQFFWILMTQRSSLPANKHSHC